MDVLERYLSSDEKAKLAGWEPFKSKSKGHTVYTKGQRRYLRKLGTAQADTDKGGYMAGFTGAKRGASPPTRRSRSGRAHQGSRLRGRRRQPDAALGLVRHLDHGRRRRARAGDVSRVPPLDERLLRRLSRSPRRHDPRRHARHASRPGGNQALGQVALGLGRLRVRALRHAARPSDLEPVWAAAQEHDLAVVLHTFTVMPPYAPGGLDTWDNLWLQRSAAHPWCGMRNMAALIGAGVMDRYPPAPGDARGRPRLAALLGEPPRRARGNRSPPPCPR